jgi:3-oxoacyl-[acyl-carrier-protein] synthase-3
MHTNYIFSGFGYSVGKYRITNSDILEAIDKGFLQGFSSSKLENSENYQQFEKLYPGKTPFDYFAGYKMGFYERHHVTPFPPTTKKLYYAETALDLGVKAIENALKNAAVQSKDIDAWMVSTVSSPEQAPGIAATIKSFFVGLENYTPTFSLSSGCAGFNINIEKAVDYLKFHPEAKNIIVAHTETMSSFLTNRIKFVPFVTFGDAAAAVVVSRVEDTEKYGLLEIVNFHDLNMLDYVGVDSHRDLYMDDSLIKDRATINLPVASEKCLTKTGWNVNDIDLFVPHQTGNVILKPAAKELGLPEDKLYLDAQNYYGNVSGATVPLGLALLNEKSKLKDNMKILSATAGVGGNYGAFSYIVKNKKLNEGFNLHTDDMKGRQVLVLGASGKVGFQLSKELASRGADLVLQGNSRWEMLNEIKNAKAIFCDFNNEESVSAFIENLLILPDFDYVVNAAGKLEGDDVFNVNFYTPIKIINSIIGKIKHTILAIGTAAEDFELLGYDSWISSNRAFHGYLASASGEFHKYGIRIVYLQPGILEEGITDSIAIKYKFKFMLSCGQASCLKIDDFCNKLASSLYLNKVLSVQYSYENAMLLGRMGYKLEVDI